MERRPSSGLDVGQGPVAVGRRRGTGKKREARVVLFFRWKVRCAFVSSVAGSWSELVLRDAWADSRVRAAEGFHTGLVRAHSPV